MWYQGSVTGKSMRESISDSRKQESTRIAFQDSDDPYQP